MKKISVILVGALFIAGTLVSCGGGKEKKDDKAKHEHHKHHDHSDHKGPKPPHKDGDHKQGPPPGGPKHNPVQTKTLEEIGGYKIGDVAADFSLKNVDGSIFSLSNIKNAKGYIIVFTCNECPFSKMYEDRLIALHNTYASQGYSVVAINPNVSAENEKESFEAMQKRATEKDFPFVYLADSNHDVFPLFGAVRTPHVFLLDEDKKVQYIGTIDDNAKALEEVKVNYLENAINALQNGTLPDPNFTKAIGCPVKAH